MIGQSEEAAEQSTKLESQFQGGWKDPKFLITVDLAVTSALLACVRCECGKYEGEQTME